MYLPLIPETCLPANGLLFTLHSCPRSLFHHPSHYTTEEVIDAIPYIIFSRRSITTSVSLLM